MPTSRLEAFSDGVLAIIITIMVLALPRPPGDAWHDLAGGWRVFLAYVLSFAYVGIYWSNHHHMFSAVQKVNGTALWANMYLLFWLSLFPYVTSWAGESGFAAVPMTCYASVAFMAAVAYRILGTVLVRVDKDNHLLAEATGAGTKEKASIAAYLVAIVSPALGEPGIVLCGAIVVGVAVAWALPDRRVERLVADQP